MKGAHVAWFSFPYAAGVIPTIPVVATLVRRGYRVTYVSSARYRSRLTNVGAEFISCPPFEDFQTSDEGHMFVRMAARTLADTKSFFEARRPDLIIYDWIAVAGLMLARTWSIPSIQTSPAFAFDNNNLSPRLNSSEYGKFVLWAAQDVNGFLARHGIDVNFPFYKEGLNIYFYPKVFQLDSDTDDDTCFFAGRCPGEQPYYRNWSRRDNEGRPILLVTTSTVYVQGVDYFKLCIDALTGLRWHVVLAIGDNNDPTSFDPLPPHFEVIQHVPQIHVLSHADLLICLGGMIITVEAMYHGVPTLMITHGVPEAELYADNFAKLGLGRHIIKRETTAENIRKSVVEISRDTALLNRVKQMQRHINREPGSEETVNRITDYLEAKTARPPAPEH